MSLIRAIITQPADLEWLSKGAFSPPLLGPDSVLAAAAGMFKDVRAAVGADSRNGGSVLILRTLSHERRLHSDS